MKIKIALLEQQVAQLKSQISDAEDRQEGLKNRYDNILLIIQQQLKEANLSEASFNVSNRKSSTFVISDKSRMIFGRSFEICLEIDGVLHLHP